MVFMRVVGSIIIVITTIVGQQVPTRAQMIVATQPASPTVFLAGRVGERITQDYVLVRTDPSVLEVEIFGLDRPTITVSNRYHTFGASDTVRFSVEYLPTVAESFSSTLSVIARTSMMSATSFSHTVHGKAVGPGPQWVVLPDLLDFGVASPFVTESKAAHVVNLLQVPVAIDLAGLGPEWTVTAQGTPVSRIELQAGASQTLDVYVDAQMLEFLVVNKDTLTLNGSVPIRPGGPTSINLPIRAHRGDGPQVEVAPDTIWFERDPTTGLIADEVIAIRNTGDAGVNLTQMVITTNDGTVVEAQGPSLSLFLDPGQDALVWLRRLNTASPITTGRVVIRGTWLGGGSILPLGEVIVRYDASAPPRGPVHLTTEAESGTTGAVVDVVFVTPSDLQPNLSRGTVTLTYNPTIMEPLTNVDPANDTITNGMRTTVFPLQPEGLRSGDVVGRLPFRLLLGNMASDTIIAEDFTWFDRSERQTDVATTSDGARMVVTDARGYELNAVSGPLSLSVSPHPVSESITVSYATPEATARISVVDELGRHVPGLSMEVVGGLHTVTMNAAALSPGLYAVVLTSGPNSFVHLFVKA